MATTNKPSSRYTNSEKELLNTTKKQLLINVGKLENVNVHFGEKPMCLQEAIEFWNLKRRDLFGQAESSPAAIKCLEEAEELFNAVMEGNEEQAKKEAIDVLMTLVAVFSSLKMSMAEIIEGVVEKTEINLNRKWRPLPDGTFSSIKPKDLDIGPWTTVIPKKPHPLGDCDLLLVNKDQYTIAIKNHKGTTYYFIPTLEEKGGYVQSSNFEYVVEKLKNVMIQDLPVEKLLNYIR